MSLHIAPSTHIYKDPSEIVFFVNEQGSLNVTIDTDRLHMRSVEPSKEDYDAYADLFGDPEVMEKFYDGQTANRKTMQSQVNVWATRWLQSDPYSALAVFKKDTQEFIGHVALGPGDEPGQSELAYLFKKNHWNQGLGTEAVAAIVTEYAPATIEEGYTLEGEPLKEIVATARTDNPYSMKILDNLGLRRTVTSTQYGAVRQHYAFDLCNLPTKV
jgi:RimJ/RimL family protein N-acetyltransferase